MTKCNVADSARTALATAILAICAVGCGEVDNPEFPPLLQRSFTATLAAPVSGDSLLVSVGTEIWTVGKQPIKLYLDTTASADSLAHFDFQVVGETSEGHETAAIDYRWHGDTLQVWCGIIDPMFLGAGVRSQKNTPAPQWLLPVRIDISAPTGVGVRYVGRWYY